MSNDTTSIATRVYDVLSDAECLSMLECLERGGYISKEHKPPKFTRGKLVWVKATVVDTDPEDERDAYEVVLVDQRGAASPAWWMPASSLKALDE